MRMLPGKKPRAWRVSCSAPTSAVTFRPPPEAAGLADAAPDAAAADDAAGLADATPDAAAEVAGLDAAGADAGVLETGAADVAGFEAGADEGGALDGAAVPPQPVATRDNVRANTGKRLLILSPKNAFSFAVGDDSSTLAR